MFNYIQQKWFGWGFKRACLRHNATWLKRNIHRVPHQQVHTRFEFAAIEGDLPVVKLLAPYAAEHSHASAIRMAGATNQTDVVRFLLFPRWSPFNHDEAIEDFLDLAGGWDLPIVLEFAQELALNTAQWQELLAEIATYWPLDEAKKFVCSQSSPDFFLPMLHNLIQDDHDDEDLVALWEHATERTSQHQKQLLEQHVGSAQSSPRQRKI